MTWLVKRWWGLVIAHGFVLGITFVLIWMIAEPLGLLENIRFPIQLSRPWFYITLTVSIGAYITLLLELIVRRGVWNRAEAVLSDPDLGSISQLEYNRLRNELTDNDVRALVYLGDEKNALPSQILRGLSTADSQNDLDKFPRRLVHLTALGLVKTIGGSEIAITDTGLLFLAFARSKRDPKYQRVPGLYE